VAEEHLIEWPVGDSGTIGIAVQHADGTPYDLTGCALTLVCRRHISDPIPALSYTATIDPTPDGETAPGTASVAVSRTHTAAMTAGALYWYDVRLVAADTTVWHVMPSSKWIPTMTVARAGEP